MNSFKWVKSSYSGGESANCVEIAVLPDGGRAVRDSKNPDGAILLLTTSQWRDLVKRALELASVGGSRHSSLSAGEITARRVGTGHGQAGGLPRETGCLPHPGTGAASC